MLWGEEVVIFTVQKMQNVTFSHDTEISKFGSCLSDQMCVAWLILGIISKCLSKDYIFALFLNDSFKWHILIVCRLVTKRMSRLFMEVKLLLLLLIIIKLCLWSWWSSLKSTKKSAPIYSISIDGSKEPFICSKVTCEITREKLDSSCRRCKCVAWVYYGSRLIVRFSLIVALIAIIFSEIYSAGRPRSVPFAKWKYQNIKRHLLWLTDITHVGTEQVTSGCW